MDPQPNVPPNPPKEPQKPKKPEVKVRGLDSGLTFKERMRQFKKKDLAFILAGLAVLFLAPLAEHFLLGPEEGVGGPSWVSRGGNALWPGGQPGYEAGTGLAPGGAAGGAPELITPLNARDPSALVMGPGAAQQPPAGSAAPQVAAAPPSSEDELKNALAGAASRGVGTGVKQAMPKVELKGSGLRGLTAVTGGYAASANVNAPSSAGLVHGPVQRGGGGLANVRPVTGYRGPAGARGLTSGGSPDGLHKAAQDAAGFFNRAGSAAGALQQAAASAIPFGGTHYGELGGASAGAGAKFPGGGGADKIAHILGSIFAFELMKKRLEKQLDLEFKEREENDWNLQGAKLRNEMLKEMATGMAKTVTGISGDAVKAFIKPPSSDEFICLQGPDGNYLETPAHIPASDVSGWGGTPSAPNPEHPESVVNPKFSYDPEKHTLYAFSDSTQRPVNMMCSPNKAGKKKDDKDNKGNKQTNPPTFAVLDNVEQICVSMNEREAELSKSSNSGTTGTDQARQTYFSQVKAVVGQLATYRDNLYPVSGSHVKDCGDVKTFQQCTDFTLGKPVMDDLKAIMDSVRNDSGAIKKIESGLNTTNQAASYPGEPEVATARTQFANNKTQLDYLQKCAFGLKLAAPSADVTKQVPDASSWPNNLQSAKGDFAGRVQLVVIEQNKVDTLLNRDSLLGCVVVSGTLDPAHCANLGGTDTAAVGKKGSYRYVIGTNNIMMGKFYVDIDHPVNESGEKRDLQLNKGDLQVPSQVTDGGKDIGAVVTALKQANKNFTDHREGPTYKVKANEQPQTVIDTARKDVQALINIQYNMLEDMRTDQKYSPAVPASPAPPAPQP